LDAHSYTYADYILFICYRIIFYLAKTIVPLDLSCLYPYPRKTDNLLPSIYLISPYILLLLASLFILLIKQVREKRNLIFGVFFFLITLLPVLQIIPVGQAIASDRYMYIPSIGLFLLAGNGFQYLFRKTFKYNSIARVFLLILFGVIIITLTFSTWQRCHIWKDSITLWNDVLKKYPATWAALNNRGGAHLIKGDYEKAIIDFKQSIRFYPNYSGVYFNLCTAYLSSGRYEEAIQECKNTIKLKPDYWEAYKNLGDTFLAARKYNEAIAMYMKTIEINPQCATAYNNLAVIYYYTKQYDNSVKHFKKAIELGYNVHPDFLEFLKPYMESVQNRP
jgi:tetratricopeptide (TPR) repeat protein